MANIVAPADFVGEISIPNSEDTKVANSINLFIVQYEPECMKALMGYELYKAFLIEPLASRFVALSEGVEYLDRYGNLNKTVPLKQLIAHYVYFYIMQDKAIMSSGVGTVIAKGDSIIPVSPAIKQIAAWNWFARNAHDVIYYLYKYEEVFPEYTWDTFNRFSYLVQPINEVFD